MKNRLKDSANPTLEKVGDIVSDIRVGMLTTENRDGYLTSRPLYTQEVDADGSIWFFTKDEASFVFDIQANYRVNVSYASEDKNEFLSIAGTAHHVHDKEKMSELWDPTLKVWFPDGLETPNICLIRVEIDSAEYWDSPGSTVVKLAGLVKSVVTGEPYRPGENKRVDLTSH